MFWKPFAFSLLGPMVCLAQLGDRPGESQPAFTRFLPPLASPALAPEQALKTLALADGFEVELMAADPLVQDPVALAFDEHGGLWVAEMRGFMPQLSGEGEQEPVGRISVLRDSNRDGRFDQSQVFVDHLVLPRALCLLDGGILFADFSKLWFARDLDGDDRADEIELVDADYILGGNPEHQPNGLLRAIDNWIYSAKSYYRYRLVQGSWIKQRTEFRGQWGITQDNYGRIFHNVNYSQLHGDLAPPNYLSRNPRHKSFQGLNIAVSTNQQVFPIRMNTGVNRGYREGILDGTGKLREFASSCSPVIYRGGLFPERFHHSAFVCDPAANLVKCNLVFDHGLRLTSVFAYPNSEFMASTDERFRPVNLSNAPDGSIYLVDMYRGIVQHRAFMTTHLRGEIQARNLAEPIHLGRIYRVSVEGHAPGPLPELGRLNPAKWVEFLSHSNGWIRDTAQRLIVEKADLSAVPLLVKLARTSSDPLARIHALWTLEGLLVQLPAAMRPGLARKAHPLPDARAVLASNSAGEWASSVREVEPSFALESPADGDDLFRELCLLLKEANPKVVTSAIRVLESLSASFPQRQEKLAAALAELAAPAASEVHFQVALTAGNLTRADWLGLLKQTAASGVGHPLIRDAILSSLHDRESIFLQSLLSDEQWQTEAEGRAALWQALASAIIKERNIEHIQALLQALEAPGTLLDWQRQALLAGMAENGRGRRFEPIALKARPALLQSAEGDGHSNSRSSDIENLFTWPGRPRSANQPEIDPAAPLSREDRQRFGEGRSLYFNACAACHGVNGEGISPVAPPLVDSEWVLGDPGRLIRILLHGLEGPIAVRGTRYQPPLILPEMPSLATLADGEIAAILTYVRRSWDHQASAIAPSAIAAVRQETEGRQQAWTEEALLQIEQ